MKSSYFGSLFFIQMGKAQSAQHLHFSRQTARQSRDSGMIGQRSPAAIHAWLWQRVVSPLDSLGSHEPLVFVKVLICKKLISRLRGLCRSRVEPRLTGRSERLSRKAAEARSILAETPNCPVWIDRPSVSLVLPSNRRNYV